MRGKFLVIDGLDGIGKGVFLEVMREESRAQGRRVLDLQVYWKRNSRHPGASELIACDLLISSEPTYVGEGKRLREDLVRPGGAHSAREIAHAFSEDRASLYQEVLIPALRRGVGVIQARSVSTSLVYQPLDAERKGEALALAEVVTLRGNRLCLAKEWAPDVLLILGVDDVREVMRRLKVRAKQDNASFETLEFQQRAKQAFESEWFRKFWIERGTKVVYADAGRSLEHSRATARSQYHQLFG